MRVRTIRAVPRFPDYIVPKGRTGTVTMLGAREVWVKFDEPIVGAEDFSNHVYWSDDLGEIAVDAEERPDVLAKRLDFFFQDVEVIDGK